MKKQLRYLSVFATAMVSLSAYADGWVSPIPEAYVPDFTSPRTEVYAFNTGAGQFMAQGNDWTTQWSVDLKPNRLYVTAITDPDDEYAGTYLLQDSAHNYGGTYSTSYYINMEDDSNVAWVDQSNYTHGHWEIIWTEANRFRLRPALADPTYGADNFPEGRHFAGVKGNESNTRIFPLLDMESEDASSFYVDWIFVNANTFNYTDWLEKRETYSAAVALGTKIEEAKASGVDTAAAQAVYDNLNSTKDELTAATTALEETMANDLENSQDPNNPTLYYSQDFNTDFDGWTSTTGAQNNTLATNQCEEDQTNTGGLNFDGKFWENWHSSAIAGKMYTTLENVPNGVYMMSLGAFCQDNPSGLYVYMNKDSVQLTQTAPNTYKIAALVTDNTIEMGLNQPEKRTQWMGIDNAKLYYYGNSAGAYAVLLQFDMDNMDYDKYASDAQYNADDKAAFVAAYESAVALIDGGSKEELIAAKEALDNAYARAYACATAYEALQNYMETGDLATVRNDNSYDAAAAASGLFDYVDEVEAGIQDGEYTMEELAAIQEKLQSLVDQTIKGSIAPGTDMTILITNPGFDDGNIDGWTQEGTYPKFGYGLCEVYEGTFKLYQNLTGLPRGVYKVECQAFFRAGGNDESEAAYLNGDESAVKSYIFGNADRTRVKNLYADAAPSPIFQGYNSGTLQPYGTWPSDFETSTGGGVPNSLEGASKYFEQGYYKNEVYVYVNDGNLQVGFVGESAETYSWTLFDNFKLYYVGADAEYIAPLIQAFIDQAAEIEESGDPFNAQVRETMNAYVETAASAIDGGDGETLMDVYPLISQAVQDAQASVEAYKTLTDALDAADASAAELDKPTDVMAAYDEVSATIRDNSNEGKYADSEIDAVIAQVKAALNTLKVSGVQPGDDVTYWLENADFTSTGGWDGDAMTYDATNQNAEFYDQAFHAYQKITGVPNGTYTLKVCAFYRAGSNQESVDQWVAGQANESDWAAAYLNNEYKKLPSQASGAEVLSSDDVASMGGTEITNNGTIYAVPNSRAVGYTYFLNEMYEPITITAVVTDGVLKVGVQKTSTKSTDWALFNYFELKYVSASTDGQGDGEEGVGISDVNAAANTPAAIYDLTGRKVSKPQKGVYIRNGKKVRY